MTVQTISAAEAAAHVKKHGLIAIVRGDYSAQEIIEIGDALLAAPVLIAEVTLNSAGALNAIADLRERYGEHMLVGAGTVRTAAQFDEAVAAGAQFTVAPNFDEEDGAARRRAGCAAPAGYFYGNRGADGNCRRAARCSNFSRRTWWGRSISRHCVHR